MEKESVMTFRALPNLITVLRLAGSVLMAVFFIYGHYQITLSIYLLLEFLDQLDGKLAKACHWETTTGKFFDPFVDSFTHLTAFAGLMTVGLVPLWMYLVFLFREFGLLFLRLLASLQRVELAGHWPGKGKALIHALAIFVCFWRLSFGQNILFDISSWLLLALTASVLSGIFYLWKYNFILRKAFSYDQTARD